MLKLISIHINKTAGTTFENILRQNYKNVFRINTHDTIIKKRRGLSCSSHELYKKIPSNAEVIHGHFKAKDLFDFENIPVISWIRNPIDRVISNYFYLLKNKQTCLSIIEYASLESSQNRMSKMLFNGAIKQFFFIGVIERFNEDLKLLSFKLGWKQTSIKILNSTNYPLINKKIRNKINKFNILDNKLYNVILNRSKCVKKNGFISF